MAEPSCQNGQGNAIHPQRAEKSPPSALEQLLEDAELLPPASIQASLMRYGHPVGLFRKQKSLATIEITRRWYYAIAACIFLFVFQALWTVGSNLLSALPKPPADEATIMARSITEASASASPTEQGSLDYSLWVIQRQNAVEGLTPWVKLTDPSRWGRMAEHPEPDDFQQLITDITKSHKLSAESLIKASKAKDWQDTVITEAKNRMDLLQQFILPLLYGWIGALAYILRSLSEQIRLWTYRKENTDLCDLRMLLGMVAGLAIGWFFKPSGTEVNGVGLVSPFALAFLAGYSVDLLFTVMDRGVAAFSKAVPVQPPGRTSPVTRAKRLSRKKI